MRQIFRASFVSLVLLACENGGGDTDTDNTTPGVTSTDPTGTGGTTGDTSTGGPSTEPTTTTPTTGTGTDDTGTDDTGPVTGTDDTGTDDTGPVTGTDDTGPDDTGTDDTGPADTGTDDTGPSGLSFAVDVYAPIIMPSCGCHMGGSGGLTMGNDAASAFAAIVGVPSNDVPDMARVEPGDSENSYLYHKVEGTHLDVGGEGNKMPLGGQLDPTQIDTIKQWIDGGAQP